MIHLLVFSLFCVFAISAQAQERTFGNGTLPEYLAVYDIDSSGGLSTEELQALRLDRDKRRRQLQNRWDLNGDGKISDREREAAKTQIRQTIEARRSLRFDEVDGDSDGFLNNTEFQNIDAVAAADEVKPGISLQLFLNLDADSDGKVSKYEFLRKLDTLVVKPDEPQIIPKAHRKREATKPPVPVRRPAD